jgi:acetyl-CoA synthetase
MLDPSPHLERFEDYQRACREFRWSIPDSFNIADAILSRHSDAVTRVALVELRSGGLNTYTYGGLDYLSDKFATALSQQGVAQGDSVAVVLSQSAPSIIAQLGALKLGAVVVPLSPALEASAFAFALKDSRARAVIIHHTHRDKLASAVSSPTAVFVVNKFKPEFVDTAPDCDFWREVFEASADFAFVEMPSNSPAFAFYGANSEGGLFRTTHNHASLIHQLPGFSMCNNFQLDEDTTFWTAQEWTSIDSSLCSVYPALWYGWRVLACESPAVGSSAWSLIERCEVTNLFVRPSELDQLRESSLPTILTASSTEFKLRSIVCAGTVAGDVYDWASESLGAFVATVYCNSLVGLVAASCGTWFEPRPGSPGRAAPGSAITIVDGRGNELPPLREGRVAVRRTDPRAPVELSPSLPNPASDSADFIVSGDVGFKDEDGYLWLER